MKTKSILVLVFLGVISTASVQAVCNGGGGMRGPGGMQGPGGGQGFGGPRGMQGGPGGQFGGPGFGGSQQVANQNFGGQQRGGFGGPGSGGQGQFMPPPLPPQQFQQQSPMLYPDEQADQQ